MTATLFTSSELLACEGLGLAPILMRPEETINVKSAIDLAGRTDKTVRMWCKEFGIGVQAFPWGAFRYLRARPVDGETR